MGFIPEILIMKFSYTIQKSKKARRVRIAISSRGTITVTQPYFLPKYFVKKFVEEKKEWIISKLKKIKINREQSDICVPRRHRQAYLNNKEQARTLVMNAIEKYNEVYGFVYNQIRIKNTKSRWGSCSEDKNLNFSYRLVYMPSYMAEYIVVHELCHLQEMNHSKNFWKLVEQTVPDYKRIEKQLKKV